VNVVLQSLMHCNVFVQLLNKIAASNFPSKKLPVFTKFAQLNNEFKPSKNFPPQPLLPEFFYDLLLPFSERTGVPYKTGDQVNQQDAQEFMNFLLDLMHEELVPLLTKADKAGQNGHQQEENSEEWEEVGKKNKSAIIVSKGESFAVSPITLIFGGKLRSIVRMHHQGAKPSVTIQPFYCLHLDIDVPQVKTIEDALTLFMSPEQLEGYQDKRNVEVSAQKQTTIEQLPRVMLLHLKRFAYDTSQALKLDKFVSFPLHLKVKSFLSSEKKATDAEKQYSLFAVVSHHGKVPAKGHYTCDVYHHHHHHHQGGEWIEFDDNHVSRVTQKVVQGRTAYLLLYQQL